MRLLVLSALVAPAPALALDLTVSGACPGDMVLVADGAVPRGNVALVSGAGAGSVAIPSGPCAGTRLGLGPAGLTLRGVLAVDATGRAALTPRVPAPACGALVQAVDLETCDVSPVRPLSGGGGGAVMFAANGRLGEFGTTLWRIDLDAGSVSAVGDLPVPLTGMSVAPDGSLWGVTASGFGVEVQVVQVDPSTAGAAVQFASEPSSWSGFTWSGDRMYMWTEDGDELHEVDPASGAVGPALYSSASFGHCMTADASGRLFRVFANTLYALDPASGVEVELGEPRGLPYSDQGQGCTFHDGLLFVAPAADGERMLYAVDVDAMVATPTGILLDVGVDALASATP